MNVTQKYGSSSSLGHHLCSYLLFRIVDDSAVLVFDPGALAISRQSLTWTYIPVPVQQELSQVYSECTISFSVI